VRSLPTLRPGAWYRVHDRNPGALRPEALEGCLWLEAHGRLEYVWAAHVEVWAGEGNPPP
jgi:hypothetical protein